MTFIDADYEKVAFLPPLNIVASISWGPPTLRCANVGGSNRAWLEAVAHAEDIAVHTGCWWGWQRSSYRKLFAILHGEGDLMAIGPHTSLTAGHKDTCETAIGHPNSDIRLRVHVPHNRWPDQDKQTNEFTRQQSAALEPGGRETPSCGQICSLLATASQRRANRINEFCWQ